MIGTDRRRKTGVFAVLLCLSACMLSCATTQTTLKPSPETIGVGHKLVVQDLRQASATLSEAFPDQPLLVVFFATYCIPFVNMIPALNRIQSIYEPRGFNVVGVSIDLQPNIMLPPFVEEFKVDFPVVVGVDNLRNANMGPLGRIAEIPTYWLLDRQGNLVFQAAGIIPAAELDKRIRNLLLDDRSPN